MGLDFIHEHRLYHKYKINGSQNGVLVSFDAEACKFVQEGTVWTVIRRISESV